jgi:hypothetical protein
MRRPVARRLIALSLLGALVGGLVVTGSTTTLLFLAPWVVVLAPLLAGRYLGERSLLRLARAARHRPPARRLSTRPAARRPSVRGLPRGGRLIACSLAVRPPPAAA